MIRSDNILILGNELFQTLPKNEDVIIKVIDTEESAKIAED